jgi:RNA polymerase sigma factor (sigma-70 family)
MQQRQVAATAASEPPRSDSHHEDADRSMVERIAAGDRDAMTELYENYQRRLFRYLSQLTADRGLAEEILQDTLMAVWRNAASFEARSSVRTWLFGVTRRQAHNALRRRGQPPLNGDALESVLDATPGPEVHALAAEDSKRLAGAMRKLSPLHREVLALVLVEGFAYSEVATMLGVPEGTVKSRLSNARVALRALLRHGRPAETRGVLQ